ncbi:Hepatic triacylglycerol lipase [Halotydeus destructor]|nr:Hepatic triacylglycerol lipase [Halotydeus destructor]
MIVLMKAIVLGILAITKAADGFLSGMYPMVQYDKYEKQQNGTIGKPVSCETSDVNNTLSSLQHVSAILPDRQKRSIFEQEYNPTVRLPLIERHRLLGWLPASDEPMNHLQLYPLKPWNLLTQFALFDKPNKDREDRGKMLAYVDERTIKSMGDNYEKIYFVTHGAKQRAFGGKYFNKLKNKLLKYQNASLSPAVVLIDWKEGSYEHERRAVNTMIVGREVALLCYMMVAHGKITRDRIHLIGYDLGAHVMHFAGQWFKFLSDRDVDVNGGERGQRRVGRITGLDPTAKDFQGYATVTQKAYLNADDADFVDIIHSSAVSGDEEADKRTGRKGMSMAVGHVDFYPNGGARQPGCTYIQFIFHACHHRKALEYFIASLSNDAQVRTRFTAYQADDYKAYLCMTEQLRAGCNTGIMSVFRRRPPVLDVQGKGIRTNTMGIEAHPPEDGEGNVGNRYFLSYEQNPEPTAANPATGSASVELEFDERFNETTLTREGYNFDTFPVHYAPIEEGPTSPLDRPGCGRYLSPPGEDGRVHYGLSPYVKQFPWTVCLVARSKRTDQILHKQFCTASLITNRFIITAAHCFDVYIDHENPTELKPGKHDFFVSFGNDCKKPILYRRVPLELNVTVFIYPGYVPLNKVRDHVDMALIKLPEALPEDLFPVDGVFSESTKLNVLCWHNVADFDYSDVCPQYYYSGYGSNGPGAMYAVTMNEQLLWTVLKKSKLADYDGLEHIFITKNSEKHRLRNICPGDSGGPVTYYTLSQDEKKANEDGRLSPYVANLVSIMVATTNGLCAQRIWFISVNTDGERLLWLEDKVANHDGPVVLSQDYGSHDFDTYVSQV